jgi:hypothetical protein
VNLHPESWPEAAVTIALVIVGGLLVGQIIEAIKSFGRNR